MMLMKWYQQGDQVVFEFSFFSIRYRVLDQIQDSRLDTGPLTSRGALATQSGCEELNIGGKGIRGPRPTPRAGNTAQRYEPEHLSTPPAAAVSAGNLPRHIRPATAPWRDIRAKPDYTVPVTAKRAPPSARCSRCSQYIIPSYACARETAGFVTTRRASHADERTGDGDEGRI